MFRPLDGAPALVGVVGPLQLDVLKVRLADEYGLDIDYETPEFQPVDLVYAALVFEYVDIARALKNLRAICLPGAVLAALLQLPRHGAENVSPSPFVTLKEVGSIMRLVPPEEFRTVAEELGFAFLSQRLIALESGKQFSLQLFKR